jgi:hypothetical protein
VSLGQLKAMSAIEGCRTAALGGHVARCENAACGYTVIAYNSCRNRHCPKCQGSQAQEWLEARKPHVHMIVPGGGISLDGSRWISSAQNYLLPVPVLSRMFRGKMLALLKAAHRQGRLQFFGPHTELADKAAFKTFLEPLYHTRWHVYAKRPFAGPQQVLAYWRATRTASPSPTAG